MSKTTVIVGVGSNISPLKNLRRALYKIKQVPYVTVISVSKIYESDPELPSQLIEYTAEAWNHQFLNAAIKIEVSHFSGSEFLKVLQDIEVDMGRRRNSNLQWAPREIDLDLLFIEGSRIDEAELIVPHQRLLKRPFALLPLIEVYSENNLFKFLNLERPEWLVDQWKGVESIPFHTQISKKYFWTDFFGILNLSLDSFSDGGVHSNEQQFKLRAIELLQSGVEVIDIGAISTRPLVQGQAREKIDIDKETDLLLKACSWLNELKTSFPQLKISVDSSHPETIDRVSDAYGIKFVNDVSGLRDQSMVDVIKSKNIRVICMHSLSVPVVKNEVIDTNMNPIEILNSWWSEKLAYLLKSGLQKDRIIFDPGIGFGKTAEQSLYILNHLDQLNSLGCSVMIGHSRKSFLQLLTNKPAALRDPETAMITSKMNKAYYQFLRIHDVESQRSALCL